MVTLLRGPTLSGHNAARLCETEALTPRSAVSSPLFPWGEQCGERRGMRSPCKERRARSWNPGNGCRPHSLDGWPTPSYARLQPARWVQPASVPQADGPASCDQKNPVPPPFPVRSHVPAWPPRSREEPPPPETGSRKPVQASSAQLGKRRPAVGGRLRHSGDPALLAWPRLRGHTACLDPRPR